LVVTYRHGGHLHAAHDHQTGQRQPPKVVSYHEVVASLDHWLVTRRLKKTSVALKRAEAELRIEREQHLSFADDAADAAGEHLTVDNAASRDEAFRASRHAEKSANRINELSVTVTKLRTQQDDLLDRLGGT
jgi:hypothetical protein